MNVPRYLRAAEVARFLGVSAPHVQKLFNLGLLSGYRCPRTGFRRIEANSVIDYARVNRIRIPELAVGPRRTTVVGADAQLRRALLGLARQRFEVVFVQNAAEFCVAMTVNRGVGIVHTSIGARAASEVRGALMSVGGVLLGCVVGDDLPDEYGGSWWRWWRTPVSSRSLVRAVTSTVRGWGTMEDEQ